MEGASIPASTIHTYHCICTALVLSTPYALDSLPIRSAPVQDQSAILPLAANPETKTAESRLHNVTSDRKPIVIRREDGFEKRSVLRCHRCKLVIGYKLDGEGIDTDVAFILPGGLVTTEDMKKGIAASPPSWATQKA